MSRLHSCHVISKPEAKPVISPGSSQVGGACQRYALYLWDLKSCRGQSKTTSKLDHGIFRVGWDSNYRLDTHLCGHVWCSYSHRLEWLQSKADGAKLPLHGCSASRGTRVWGFQYTAWFLQSYKITISYIVWFAFAESWGTMSRKVCTVCTCTILNHEHLWCRWMDVALRNLYALTVNQQYVEINNPVVVFTCATVAKGKNEFPTFDWRFSFDWHSVAMITAISSYTLIWLVSRQSIWISDTVRNLYQIVTGHKTSVTSIVKPLILEDVGQPI